MYLSNLRLWQELKLKAMQLLYWSLRAADAQGPDASSPGAELYGGFAEQLLQNLLSIPEPHAYFPLKGMAANPLLHLPALQNNSET